MDLFNIEYQPINLLDYYDTIRTTKKEYELKNDDIEKIKNKKDLKNKDKDKIEKIFNNNVPFIQKEEEPKEKTYDHLYPIIRQQFSQIPDSKKIDYIKKIRKKYLLLSPTSQRELNDLFVLYL